MRYATELTSLLIGMENVSEEMLFTIAKQFPVLKRRLYEQCLVLLLCASFRYSLMWGLIQSVLTASICSDQ